VDILSKIQTKLIAPKNQRNNFGNYSYRSCEDILEALKPLLNEYQASIVFNDTPVIIGDRYYIESTATLIDSAGKQIQAKAFAREPDIKKGMDVAQVTGSSSSYARKYALNGLFAIDDTKDPDTTNRHQKDQKNTETKTITPNQLKKVFAVLGETKSSETEVKKFFSLESMKDMTQTQFNEFLQITGAQK